MSKLGLGPTHGPIQWIPEFFNGVKWPLIEVNHTPLSDAVVRNAFPMCLFDVDRKL
jgi:hypothetical protein